MRKSLNKFSLIACNSTIPSDKQGQEHKNLVAIQKNKTEGSPWVLQKPPTQMQTLTKVDKVLIKDNYNMTIMEENVDWIKLTSIVNCSLSNLAPPLCKFTFIWVNIIQISLYHPLNMPPLLANGSRNLKQWWCQHRYLCALVISPFPSCILDYTTHLGSLKKHNLWLLGCPLCGNNRLCNDEH
jgi:hypothetical protein